MENEWIDLGLALNAEHGHALYEAGELLQFCALVCGVRVWVAHETRRDIFRVAFGDKPRPLAYCEAMSREQAVMRVWDVVRKMALTPLPSASPQISAGAEYLGGGKVDGGGDG